MKRKAFQRAVSILLLIAALLSVSCGGSGSSVQTTSADDSTDTSAIENDGSEYIKPEVDYGGRTVTISSYDYSDGYVIQNYRIDLDEENGDLINDAIVKRNRQVEEELNIDIMIYSLDKNDRYDTKKLETMIYAGDKDIDFALHMYNGLASIVASDGMLVELNSIPTLDLSHSWWNQSANEEFTLYGKQYVALGDIGLFNLGSPRVIFFSKKLVEDNKLGDLYSLVYDGTWTMDKMVQMSIDISKDLNGDQAVDDGDQFGFLGQTASLLYFVQSAGVRICERDSDGNFKLGVNSEMAQNVTELIAPFLNNSNATRVEGTTASKFKNSIYNEYFIPKLMSDQALFFQNALHVALNLRKMNSDFGILPVPKYDEAQENYVGTFVESFSDYVIVPVTTTELEMIGNVIEAMGYYAQQYITPAFIDSTVMDKTIRDEDSANMIELVRENMSFDIGSLFNWGGIKSIFDTLVKTNSTGFASSYASKLSQIEAELEKTIEMLS